MIKKQLNHAFQKTIRLLGILMALLILICLTIYTALEYQDQTYATKYFNFISYDTVLESKKWHHEIFGCTYAIISLPEDASITPPKEWLDEITWYETPIVFNKKTKSNYCKNLICNCEQDLNLEIMSRLNSLLSKPGSFYYFHKTSPPHPNMGEGVIYIYSKPEKLAARVRYGD